MITSYTVTISRQGSINVKHPVYSARNNIRITDKELELLEMINRLGPCTSEKVHESLDAKFEYLFVLRSLHVLVEKGFLKRIMIDKKQVYRTSKNYSYVRSFLSNSSL